MDCVFFYKFGLRSCFNNLLSLIQSRGISWFGFDPKRLILAFIQFPVIAYPVDHLEEKWTLVFAEEDSGTARGC